jgi:hypothetical protein
VNPYLFIVGSHRSGTTLLRRIVEAHSRIAVAPETQWLAEFYKKRVGLTSDGAVTPLLVVQLLADPKFHHMHVGPGELGRLLGPGEPPPYARFVGRIFDAYGRAQGKPLVGEKTPNHVRQIRVLHALWSQAKFVHLIRDGRDACLSVLAWKRKAARLAELFPTWKEDSLTTAALFWERDVSQGRDQGRPLGTELYYEIRYESLVLRPAEEVEKLCSFLRVPYEADMLEFNRGRTRSEPGLSPKEAWLPITPGLRDWRAQMLAGDVERFASAAGGLLDELGYPRGAPSPPQAARDRSAYLRECFERGLAAREGAVSGR